ncbi:MAG: hypothetical protein CVU56_00425 [Deltaproteobacteria bacterium HGW-Deltaproteobacteria-14]|jgi:uncharacterized membrane protein|nr:MAG: hypothetical protein CVU56_00425 [Deltaproteobacteria bacterium HGW-Deltaproteobacteria-14]
MTLPLLAALEPTTERTLTFLGGGELWLDVAVWALGALVLGLTVWNHRRLLPVRRRLGMIALRAALVLTLILIFYQPAFLEERVAVHKNTVVVLADSSESMGLPHGPTTRLELERKLLERMAPWLDGLRDGHDLAFYRFGDHLADLPDLAKDPDAVREAVKAEATETRIVDTLGELRDRFRNQDIGGVVLLTDGIDTSGAGRRATLGLDTQAVLRDLDAPIYSFTTAGDDSVKDISVAHVAYNNFAFLLNATSLDATIEVHGYASGTIPVHLTENGQLVATQDVVVSPLERDYKVHFDFVPKKLGKHVFGVEAERQPDEIYAKNNLKQVIINIVRDKIRVVQIVGQPSWDERYLRNLLKENPNVDLVSFFILVNRFNLRPLSTRDTSLIPFPAQELFAEELGGFDLLIFQNFNYGPFQTRQYLPFIAQFVKDGGAFAMVGGPLSLSAGGYYGTPITDVLPVEIPPSFGAAEDTLDTQPFTPVLTESGRFHPITRLALEPATNKAIWNDITPLEGQNLVTRARQDAVTLLEHPRLKTADGDPQPVVSVREVGEGRSMVVTTDSTWHWAFKAGGAGKDPQNYESFWWNAIRWLIKDPELDLVKVKVLKESVPVGQPAQALITVFRADYRPAANQEVGVVVRRRGPGDGRGEGEEILRVPDAKTDAAGELRLDVPVDRAGIYEVDASSRVVTGRAAEGMDLFVGTDSNPEYDRVVGDARLLDNLAQASQGAVFGFDGDPTQLQLKEPQVIRVKSRQHKELWNAWWVLLLVAGLFGFEWWLRRRYGYL